MKPQPVITKDEVVSLLASNDRALIRALEVINLNQTADERSSEATRVLNGKGFRPCHARMGTSMVKFYQRTGMLTAKQIAYWRKTDKGGNMRIGIYWKQLQVAAAEKAASKGAA